MALGMPMPRHPFDLWVAFTFVSFAFRRPGARDGDDGRQRARGAGARPMHLPADAVIGGDRGSAREPAGVGAARRRRSFPAATPSRRCRRASPGPDLAGRALQPAGAAAHRRVGLPRRRSRCSAGTRSSDSPRAPAKAGSRWRSRRGRRSGSSPNRAAVSAQARVSHRPGKPRRRRPPLRTRPPHRMRP